MAIPTSDCIVFDTDCVLCSGWVHFILRHESDQNLLFISAWSATGQAIAKLHGISPDMLHKTYLVVKDGQPLMRSDAGLALLRRLHSPWRWLAVFKVIPRPVRDMIYNLIARNRYSLSGRKEQCFVPPPESRHRFIDR